MINSNAHEMDFKTKQTEECVIAHWGFPAIASGKEPVCQCRRHKRCGFEPWVRKIPRGGHGNPLQYFCLENPMDRGTWQATVTGLQRAGRD